MLIGLTGKKRHGKGTVGGVLVRDYGFTQIDFTDALNDCLVALNPIVGYETVDSRSFVDPCPVTTVIEVRYAQALAQFGYDGMKDMYPESVALLQRMGTDVGRNLIDADLWTKLWEKTINQHLVSDNIVVTNVRFDNEASMVQDEFWGKIIRVVRPGYVHDVELDKHKSEGGISDYFVNRTFTATTVEDLEMHTHEYMRELEIERAHSADKEDAISRISVLEKGSKD